MKITCQSCQAKYTIADEKVLGKVVKIRCKKCGATIVVNGNDPQAITTTESGPPEVPRPHDSTDTMPGGFTVNVADGDQRRMTVADVVAAFHAGTIDGETYCWRDGMEDWAPLRDVAELKASCMPDGPSAPNSVRGGNGAGTYGGSAAAAAAARRGGRAAAADLFGAVAQAGGEDDVLTSAPAKMPQAHDESQKRTGARNENSVLFSMGGEPKRNSEKHVPAIGGPTEASGLIDIRQLSAQLAVEDKKSNRVDDIMNLSGGGAFVPNLAAPVLVSPSVEDYGVSAGLKSLTPSGKNKGLIILALGGGACLVVAAVGAAVFFMRGRGPEEAAADKAKSAVIAAAMTASAAATELAPPAPAALTVATERPAVSAVAAAEPPPVPSPPPAAIPPPKEGKMASNAPAPRAPRETPSRAAPVIEVDQPFNMGEAKARLGAAANSASGCKKPGGPTGTGRVVVVFATSGAAQSATITGDPYQGTPTGACVAQRFRAVRVPPFSGSPFSVSKSFTIN